MGLKQGSLNTTKYIEECETLSRQLKKNETEIIDRALFGLSPEMKRHAVLQDIKTLEHLKSFSNKLESIRDTEKQSQAVPRIRSIDTEQDNSQSQAENSYQHLNNYDYRGLNRDRQQGPQQPARARAAGADPGRPGEREDPAPARPTGG